MEQNFPLVSIIITSYNRANLISKAIESALAQDYPNLEIIISDNCSTDQSDAIISKYTNDPRVKFSKNSTNIGMIPNFRKATYELSKGEYITYISSDDYLTDNSFVSDSIKLVKKYENIVLVHGRMSYMDTLTGVLWEMPESPYFLEEIRAGKDVFFQSIKAGLLSWGACLLRKEAMTKAGAFQKEYHNADIDADYKMMLGSSVGFLNKVCYWQLGHTDNSGYPTDPDKILLSMECFENVADYALKEMPGEKERIEEWRRHFLFSIIYWAFYSLKEKNKKEEFRIFKTGAQKKYPAAYNSFIKSWKYKKLLIVQPVKRALPVKIVRLISNIHRKIKSQAK